MPLGENGGVKILNLAGGGNCGVAPSTVKVRDIFWVAPDKLAIRVSFFFVPEGAPSGPQYQYEIRRYIVVNADCRGGVDVLRDHKDYGRLAGFAFIGRMSDGRHLLFGAYNVRTAGMISEVTSVHMKRRDRTSLDVYKFDMTTGKSEPYQAGNADTVGWIADSAGNLRIRIDSDQNDRTRVFARLGESTSWEQVHDSGLNSDESRQIGFLAMSSQPDIAYVGTRNGEDKLGVYEFSLSAKSIGRLVFKHPKVDVDTLQLDSLTDQAIGAAYTLDYPSQEFFDRTYVQLQADVRATFPGEHVTIESATHDRKKFVALVEGPQNPTGVYYLVDMTGPSIGKIGARYASVTAADIGQVKAFSYQARDGLTIPAFLTLPPGSSGKNLPLVVMPHGGPHSRDTASFDPWAQFLASRGYAVLQPQFRGSSGYGAAHASAGRHKWGLEMQNDISDGVKHLIANGTANPSKVCIYGWSYGGYAAMAGLAFTPDYYKCGVAGAGISDLLLLLGDSKRRWGEWDDSIGSPINDRERLERTSPIRSVNRINAPLLLIHPKEDTVVPLRQSSMMAKAMQDAGKPVEYIELEGDDHWLSKASTSKRVLRELERFLGQHLK
jgi:dipeptidyl aminopeptidase/acylaminoacyl peptidase